MPANLENKNKSNEIYLTRIYDAPLKIVWDAWADASQAAQWWGPRGFTTTTHRKDLRSGGIWEYTMHGPDGKNYPNLTKYLEVIEYSRMVYDHGATATTPPLFRVSVDFTDLKEKTQIDITMSFESEASAINSKKFIKQAGGNATWDRLAEHLEKSINSKEIFVINRSFETDINTLFKLWTDPKHVAQWTAPKGFFMTYIKADIRVGGESFYKMNDAQENFILYGKVQYRELLAPKKLVYTQQFSDKDGNISRHPMAPIWPETMLTTVTFTQEAAKQTRVTIQWEVFGQASTQEVTAFVKEKPGMTIGWTGSLDKLEEYLLKLV